MADEESKSKFMDILARGAEGAVDGLAESYPILGGAVQAMANTDEYQARQLQKQVATQKAKDYLAQSAYLNDQLQYEQEQRDFGRKQMAEWDKLQQNRDQNAKTELAESQVREATAKGQLPYAEQNAAAKIQADTEKANTQKAVELQKQYELDRVQFNERVAGQKKNLQNELANNPYLMNLSYDEQSAYFDSPDVRNMLEASVYLEDIQGIAKGDKDAYGRMERLLAHQGFDLVDGKDGMMYLDMGNGSRIAATPQNISKIFDTVKGAAFEELQARNQISMAACLGNPAQSSISKYAKALMPHNNSSAARSLKQVQSVYKNASPEQKTWTFFNQAIQDYANPNLPMTARLAGLQKCIPGLMQLGYAMEGYDPKAPSMDNVRILKLEDGFKPGKIYSFSQFADLCKSKDTISAQLDDMVTRNRIADGYATMVEAVKNVKETGKAAKGEEHGSEVDPVEAQINEIRSSLEGNPDAWGLSDDALDSVVKAHLDYGRHAEAVLKEYNVGNEFELPTEIVEKLDADYRNKISDIKGIKSTNTLNQSPVHRILEAIRTEREKYSDLKREYEEKTTVHGQMTRPNDYAPTTRSTVIKQGKIPESLHLKQKYKSAKEELEDLRKQCSELGKLLGKENEKKSN